MSEPNRTSEQDKTLTRRFYEEVFNQKQLGTFNSALRHSSITTPHQDKRQVYKGQFKGLDAVVTPNPVSSA
jgi:hypothetical protein